MPILKYDDIIKKGDPLAELKKSLKETDELVKKVTKSNQELSKALNLVKQTNDGSEARNLVKINSDLIKSNVRLKEVKTANQRASEQLLKANAKLAQAQTKEAQQVALVNEKIRQQNKILRDNAKATLGVQKRLGTFTKQLLGAAGLVGAATAVVSVFRNAIKVFTSFDKSASKLASILGKTKDQIKGLTEQAKNLGAVTAYTASQVLEAQTNLAKLGFTANQIQDAIPGVLSLAAATGTDLAQSADLAASTLRIFNMDASEMGKVSDILAKSTTISSLSMEKLATIMPTVGKTAQLAGVSLERTAALAGTLTDRGLDASTAATSLRNIFLELSKKGLTWEQAMQKINSSTNKNKTAMDLFGKRAAAAGAILAETGATTDDLTRQLENSAGAAQEMADVMLDNLAGDMTKAQSAWEGFILSLEDGEGTLSTIARNITQFFTGLLQALKNFNEETSKLDDFSKKKLGLTEKENRLLKEQQAELKGITDKEQQRQKAIEIYTKLQKEKNYLEKVALTASQEGNKRGAIAAQAEIDIRLKLLENVKQYIPELRKETDQVKETEKEVKKLTAAERKLYKQRQKDREDAQKERIRRASARLENELLDITSGIGGNVGQATQSEVDAFKKKEQEKADAKKAIFEQNNADLLAMNQQFLDKQSADNKKAAEDDADFRKKAEELLYETLNEFGSLYNNLQLEGRKQAIESERSIEEAVLKDRLDKGLINEIQYQTQLAEINKKAREKEARAEKRKALYDVAVQGIVAFVKGLVTGGLGTAIRNAALVAAKGAALAVIPIPKFKKGGWHQGASHEQGGVLGEFEGGEFTVAKQHAANATEILEGVNKGLITDKNFGLNKGQKDNLMLGMMMQGLRKDNQTIIELLGNGGYAVPKNGYVEVRTAKGEIIRYVN